MLAKFIRYKLLSGPLRPRTSPMSKKRTSREGDLFKTTPDADAHGLRYLRRTRKSKGNIVVSEIFTPRTVGDCAWRKLTAPTDQNFWKDEQKWIIWIKAHEAQRFPDPDKPRPPEVIRVGEYFL